MNPEHLQKFIPPEFDLAKYEETSQIDLWDWACNLAKRCGLRYEIYDDELTIENIKSGVFIADKTNLRYDDSISVVREITVKQVLVMSEELSRKIETDKYLHENNEDSELNEFISNTDVNTDWLMADPAWLEVDMLCSDKEIKTSFENWLKAYRGNNPARHKKLKRRQSKLNEFSAATLRRWHDARVLAFLDLEAWNFLEGNKITDQNYGDILFPEFKNLRNNSDYIRNTVKPLAEQLSSQDVIMRMRKVFIDSSRQNIS